MVVFPFRCKDEGHATPRMELIFSIRLRWSSVDIISSMRNVRLSVLLERIERCYVSIKGSSRRTHDSSKSLQEQLQKLQSLNISLVKNVTPKGKIFFAQRVTELESPTNFSC